MRTRSRRLKAKMRRSSKRLQSDRHGDCTLKTRTGRNHPDCSPLPLLLLRFRLWLLGSADSFNHTGLFASRLSVQTLGKSRCCVGGLMQLCLSWAQFALSLSESPLLKSCRQLCYFPPYVKNLTCCQHQCWNFTQKTEVQVECWTLTVSLISRHVVFTHCFEGSSSWTSVLIVGATVTHCVCSGINTLTRWLQWCEKCLSPSLLHVCHT